MATHRPERLSRQLAIIVVEDASAADTDELLPTEAGEDGEPPLTAL